MAKPTVAFCFRRGYTKNYPHCAGGIALRYHVIWRKSHEPEEAYRDFFETNDIYEAKDFAMRLAFDETNLVCVRDEKRDEIVRDFDAEVYR